MGHINRPAAPGEDRKSTRLNSSHSQISYAVFCLKKKTKYSPKDLSGKLLCKQDLLKTFGLPDIPGRPVVGIVSRFADQKGFDLIAEVAPEIMREDMALIVLGTGDKKYEELFRTLALAYPDRVGVRIAYDNAVAHKIEAGSDIFLMPSRYEPCGLNQIYSLKYGTVPIVRATGGFEP